MGVGVGLGAGVGCSVDVVAEEGADGACLAVPVDWSPPLSENTATKIISKTNNPSKQTQTTEYNTDPFQNPSASEAYRRLTLALRSLAAV